MIGAWTAGSRNGPKAKLCHALDQRLAVARVARQARGLPAFCLELIERRVQRDDHVRRRRVAPLRGLLHVRRTGRAGPAPASARCRRSSRAALLRRSRSPCRAGLRGTCRTRRPARRTGRSRTSIGSAPNELIASTIRPLPCCAHDARDAGEVVQDAGAGLAVDCADVRDRRIVRRAPPRRSPRSSAGRPDRRDRRPRGPGILQSFTIRLPYAPLFGTSTWPSRGTSVADRRLDRERAAALHRHARRSRRRRRRCRRGRAATPAVIRVERGVPRAPVAQHRLLGRERGGQRAGRQQDRIVADGSSGSP